MDFYYSPGSAPCHSVIMLAKAVGVELNLKTIAIRNGENRTPEYLKLNPQHTIPTLVDNGFSLWESRAILMYLAEKYGKDDSLYPKCPQKRAVVNQRLFFDMGTLYKSFADYFYPQFLQKLPADPEKLVKMGEAFEFLNTFLEGQTYVAGGDSLTIADFAFLASLATIKSTDFVDFNKYPNVAKYYETMTKAAPSFDEIWGYCESKKQMIFEMMKK